MIAPLEQVKADLVSWSAIKTFPCGAILFVEWERGSPEPTIPQYIEGLRSAVATYEAASVDISALHSRVMRYTDTSGRARWFAFRAPCDRAVLPHDQFDA